MAKPKCPHKLPQDYCDVCQHDKELAALEAEIERLNAAFDRLQHASEVVVAEDAARIAAIEAENGRLRKALVWIAENEDGPGLCFGRVHGKWMIQFGDNRDSIYVDGTDESLIETLCELAEGE